MVWGILVRLIIVIIGFLLIFKTSSSILSGWLFDSDLKSNTRRWRLLGVRTFGLLLLLMVIVDYFRYFIVEYLYRLFY